jgi:hypothetical protein
MAKVYTAWDSLAHGKSNGAVVVVKARVPAGEPLEASRARERDFLEALVVATRSYLPAL